VLYAGRKANALGVPLSPDLVVADTLADALTGRPAPPSVLNADALRPPGGWGREVAHDPCTGFLSGLRERRRYVRRDASANRGRWQFSERTVELGELPSGETVAEAR